MKLLALLFLPALLSAEWSYQQTPGDKVVYFEHRGPVATSIIYERATLIVRTVPGVKHAVILVRKGAVSIEVEKDSAAKWADIWDELTTKLVLSEASDGGRK